MEAKDVLGGFYMIDCKDRDEALASAAKIPDAQCGVEVRPVMQVPGWDYAHAVERKALA